MSTIWFDTEFIEDGKTIELLSIGMVREDGVTYYAEVADVDYTRASQWVRDNVIVHLTGETKPRVVIAREIVEFVGAEPEFWAYYSDYDWVVLCQLFGTMMDLPKGWPMFCHDLKQLADKTLLAEQTGTEHHALADAIWTRNAHIALAAELRAAGSGEAVGDEWQTVPREPTRAMCVAGWNAHREYPAEVYRAMLAAAPLAPWAREDQS